MPVFENKIELHLPSVIGYEKIAMQSAAAIAEMMGFHRSKVEDLKTAVAEACINAIEHGNRLKENTKVLISLQMDKEKLEVNVKDQGKGLKRKIGLPHIDKQVDGCESVRGWGIFLIKNLVDEVEFKKIPRGGNVTRMVIHLKH